MKFSICNETFQGWELGRIFEFAREAGYDALEIAPFTLARRVTEIPQQRRDEIRALATRHGMQISGIHWVLAQTEGLHLTTRDDTVLRNTSAYLAELVEFCADIGGEFMILGSPKQRDLIPGMSEEEGMERARLALRPAVETASRRNVVICFEPLAPSETNFINTAAKAIRFARSFQSRSMKIILDVKAMSSESIAIPRIIEESRGEFAYFHANDQNLKGPGFGTTDFTPIGAALRAVGYDGYVSVEVFRYDEGPEAIATRSRQYLRSTVG